MSAAPLPITPLPVTPFYVTIFYVTIHRLEQGSAWGDL